MRTERLPRTMRGVLAAALAAGALVLPAWGLDDPTRPPAGLRGAAPARSPGPAITFR